MNTYYFNSRCEQNYLEDTSGPGIHRGTHLGAPFSLRMTWTSTTSGFKDALVFFNDIIDQFNNVIDQARSILLLLAWLRL